MIATILLGASLSVAVSAETQSISKKAYNSIKALQSANALFDANLVATVNNKHMRISAYISSRNQEFFRSIDFGIYLPNYQPSGERNNPDVALYWLTDYRFRVGIYWQKSSAYFFEITIDHERGFPQKLSASRDFIVRHAATVLDVVGAFVLTEDTQEDIKEIQLVDSKSGAVFLSTHDATSRMYPQSVKFSIRDGQLIIQTTCRIEKSQQNPMMLFHNAFRCIPAGNRFPFAYKLLASGYVQVADGIYKDDSGRVYFKVINRDLAHPSKLEDYTDFRLLDEVFNGADWRPLHEMVDLSSIKRIQAEGMYFKDKNHVYIYPRFPVSGTPPFFAVEYRKAHFFGLDMDYVKIDDAVFSHGVPVPSLKADTTGYLQAYDQRTSTRIELLTGETHLYQLYQPLSFKDFCLLQFDTTQLKEKLRSQYFPELSCLIAD